MPIERANTDEPALVVTFNLKAAVANDFAHGIDNPKLRPLRDLIAQYGAVARTGGEALSKPFSPHSDWSDEQNKAWEKLHLASQQTLQDNPKFARELNSEVEVFLTDDRNAAGFAATLLEAPAFEQIVKRNSVKIEPLHITMDETFQAHREGIITPRVQPVKTGLALE